jgi:hypothetical protein
VSTTLLELQALQARRPGVVEEVNAAEAALDKAHGAVKQAGVDFTRLNNLLAELFAKEQKESEAAYRRFIADPTLDPGELAAPLAARKAVLDFIRGNVAYVADIVIPDTNIAARRAILGLAEPKATLTALEEEIVKAELVHMTVPIAGAQGKVNVSSEALTIARNKAAAAARDVTEAQTALHDEIARQEERKRQRASRGFVSWNHPS